MFLASLTGITFGQDNTYYQKVRTFFTKSEFEAQTKGKVRMQRTNRFGTYEDSDRGILFFKRSITLAKAEVKWIGTDQGLYRITRDGRTEYFGGRRWLPDDKVTGLGEGIDGVWVETSGGFSLIQYLPMTLEKKSASFVERVQLRHNRWGQTADSHLMTPGDLKSNRMVSSDNDGLWTAMYVAAECFRYKVTGAADARQNARTGMNALIRLESITGIPGFPARSIIKVGVDEQPRDGEWHDTADGQWRWKGDTSSDEIVGHYFVYPIYYDLLADELEKPVLRGVIERITNHILDHNYQLIGPSGKRTTWGFWGPEVIIDDADETGLRALHILAHLRVAAHMTGDANLKARYQAAYDELISKHQYHLLTRNQKIMVPGHINHSDDELAFLSYYPLLTYETNPSLLAVYRESLERSWQIERPERNPLWNFIYAAGTLAKDFDREQSLRTLREIPFEQIEWSVKNSHRREIPMDPASDRFKRRQALVVLPYDELPMSKWNGNPYIVDGGNNGRSEDDGAYFLLPYWMGRYHKLINE